MFNPHSLSWPEITILSAALGLLMNASIGFYRMKKPHGGRNLQALRVPARRRPINPKH